MKFFWKKYLKDISSFCWATDNPVNFLKDIISFVGPLIPLFWTYCDVCPGFQSQGVQQNPQIHLWCDTCWPLGGQHGSWAILIHVPANKHWWGLSLGSIMSLPHSVRQDWCSTNWAMPSLLPTIVKINIPKITLAMLAQLGRHQSESEEVPGTIPTGGNFFLAEFILLFLVKHRSGSNQCSDNTAIFLSLTSSFWGQNFKT